MRIAVLTCTRDRLEYTAHCFETLHDRAGCDFDHYVLDQGSRDGTAEWLEAYDSRGLILSPTNIGIWRGFNRLAELAREQGPYDAFVTFDNDCELLTPDTLEDVCRLAVNHDLLLSPRILGLRNPPPALGRIGDEIELTGAIGNIFMALPAWVLEQRPFDEGQPLWGGDEWPLAEWMRSRGHGVGYAIRYEANHHETTDGQHARYPEYFAQKAAEGCPV